MTEQYTKPNSGIFRGKLDPTVGQHLKDMTRARTIAPEAVYFPEGEDAKAIAVAKIMGSIVSREPMYGNMSPVHANINLEKGPTPTLMFISNEHTEDQLAAGSQQLIGETNQLLQALESPIQL